MISPLKIFLFTAFMLPVLTHAQSFSEEQCKKNLAELDGMKTSMLCDKMPTYHSGDADVLIAIAKILKYPQDQHDLQPRVNVGFVIDTLGQVRNACITKRFSVTQITPIEKEVLKAIQTLKDWTPGEQNGKKVPVRYFMPIIIDVKK
jgi:hypothetical protein